MIDEVVALLALGLVAGGLGLWLGIVVIAPRLRRRIENAEDGDAREEPDGRAD
jgi:hypothetical protein